MKWKVANVDEKVSETKYEVKGLQKEAEYEFRVTAENKMGPGQPSDPSKMAKYGTLLFPEFSSLIILLHAIDYTIVGLMLYFVFSSSSGTQCLSRSISAYCRHIVRPSA